MPLFFIISGITLKKTASIQKYFRRLLVPYLIWSLVATGYELLQTPQLWKSILFVNTFNTLSTYGIAPFWFLASLFIAVTICLFIVRTVSNHFYIIGLAVVLLLVTSMSDYFPQNLSGNLVKAQIRNCWGSAFVFLGYCLPIVSKRKILCIVLVCSGMLSCLFLLNTGVNMHKLIIGNPIVFTLSATGGSFFILALAQLLGQNACAELIGRNSLSIMCLHYKTMPVWNFVAWFTGHLCGWSAVVVQSALLIGISLPVGMLIEHFVPFCVGKSKQVNDGIVNTKKRI